MHPNGAKTSLGFYNLIFNRFFNKYQEGGDKFMAVEQEPRSVTVTVDTDADTANELLRAEGTTSGEYENGQLTVTITESTVTEEGSSE